MVTEPSTVVLKVGLDNWHQRLAHVHTDETRQVVRNGVVQGVSADLKSSVLPCEGCICGKASRAPISKQKGARCLGVLHKVHTDVGGPMQVSSHGG